MSRRPLWKRWLPSVLHREAREQDKDVSTRLVQQISALDQRRRHLDELAEEALKDIWRPHRV